MGRNAFTICITLALLLAYPLRAAACSVGPAFDPRDHTQLLVLGRASSIEHGSRTALGFLEATVTLDVTDVYRGTTAWPLRLVDSTSVGIDRTPVTGKHECDGGSGACGTIDD